MSVRALTAYGVDPVTQALTTRARGDVAHLAQPFDPQQQAAAVAVAAEEVYVAAYPRLTVNDAGTQRESDSPFQRQIPRQSYFYDDVDRITHGNHERGRILDATA